MGEDKEFHVERIPYGKKRDRGQDSQEELSRST